MRVKLLRERGRGHRVAMGLISRCCPQRWRRASIVALGPHRVLYSGCRASGHDTNWVVEALSQTLQAAVCAGGPLEPLSGCRPR
jgi:hypothetical protein